jgi:hypothetical protein
LGHRRQGADVFTQVLAQLCIDLYGWFSNGVQEMELTALMGCARPSGLERRNDGFFTVGESCKHREGEFGVGLQPGL